MFNTSIIFKNFQQFDINSVLLYDNETIMGANSKIEMKNFIQIFRLSNFLESPYFYLGFSHNSGVDRK